MIHDEIEILDMQRNLERSCRLAASKAEYLRSIQNKDYTVVRYYLEHALAALTYLENENEKITQTKTD